MKNKIEELITNVESYKSSIFAKEDVIDMLKDLINDDSVNTIFEKESDDSSELDLVDFKEKLESFFMEKTSQMQFTDLVNQEECDFRVENYNQIVIEKVSLDSDALVRILLDGFEFEFEVD